MVNPSSKPRAKSIRERDSSYLEEPNIPITVRMNDKLAFDMLVSKALNRQSPFEMAKSILESCIVADIVTKPAPLTN